MILLSKTIFFPFLFKRSNKIAATQKRIQNINDYLTYRTWFYTTRGLYEEDRLMFTLLLALRIDLRRGKIRHDEFEVLIKGGASLDLNTCPTKPFRYIRKFNCLSSISIYSFDITRSNDIRNTKLHSR